MSEGRLPVIAISLAVVAVLLAGIATIVVATRGSAVQVSTTKVPELPEIRRVSAD